ncbi:MAG TPA: DHHA1 domain-containing protein, partial [Burkholderiaceae bacterium]|nr:DHHA1 domain-containing protein [Burkholderiaceae bacterium]
EHVQQRGSLVDAERTRFDFAHDAPLTPEQIAQVERLVNAEILANNDVGVSMMPYEKAVEGGAMALFGEKYDDVVRVLDIGFSRELCGGTHVRRTGDIGLFKIVSEGGVAAGVRRVEAITGKRALEWLFDLNSTVQRAASLVKTQPANLIERIEGLQNQVRNLEREREQLKSKLDSARGSELIDQAISLPGDAKLLVASLEGVDPKGLRAMADQAKDKLKSAVVMLASVLDGRVSLVAGVTHDLTDQIKAGELVGMVASQVGGKGGGRPDMAMGGGTSAQNLPAALDSTRDWVLQRLDA